jgi:hypothetical protein
VLLYYVFVGIGSVDIGGAYRKSRSTLVVTTPSSNLGPRPDNVDFLSFQANNETIDLTSIQATIAPSVSFPVHCSLITLPFDTVPKNTYVSVYSIYVYVCNYVLMHVCMYECFV